MDTSYGDKEIVPKIKSSPEGDSLATANTLFVYAVSGPNISIPGSSNTTISTQNGIDDITYKGIYHDVTAVGNTTMTFNSLGAQSAAVYDYVFNTEGTGNNKSYYSTTSNVFTLTDCVTYVGNLTTGVGDQIVFDKNPNFSSTQAVEFENVPANVSHLANTTFYITDIGSNRYQIFTNSGGSIRIYNEIGNVDVTGMNSKANSYQYVQTVGIPSMPTSLQNAAGMVKVLAVGGGGAGNVAGGGGGAVVFRSYSLNDFVEGNTYVLSVGAGGNANVVGEGQRLPSNANTTIGAGNNTIVFNGTGSFSMLATGGGAGDVTQGGFYGDGNGGRLNSGPTPTGDPQYSGYDHENNYVPPGSVWGSAGSGWTSSAEFQARYARTGVSGVIPTSAPGVIWESSKDIRNFDFDWALTMTHDTNPGLNFDNTANIGLGFGGAGSGLDNNPFANISGTRANITYPNGDNICPGLGRYGGGTGYSTNLNAFPGANCSVFTSTDGTDGTGGGGGGTLQSRSEITEGGSGSIKIRYPYAQFRFVSTSNIA